MRVANVCKRKNEVSEVFKNLAENTLDSIKNIKIKRGKNFLMLYKSNTLLKFPNSLLLTLELSAFLFFNFCFTYWIASDDNVKEFNLFFTNAS